MDLFTKCTCGRGGLAKLWWMLVMLVSWNICLLVWTVRPLTDLTELKGFAACRRTWLSLALKQLVGVIVPRVVSVVSILLKCMLSAVTPVPDSLTYICLLRRLTSLIPVMLGMCSSLSRMCWVQLPSLVQSKFLLVSVQTPLKALLNLLPKKGLMTLVGSLRWTLLIPPWTRH